MASGVESSGVSEARQSGCTSPIHTTPDLAGGTSQPPTTPSEDTAQESGYMTRIGRSDRQAFDAFHRKWSKPIATFFAARSLNPNTVEDLTQEVFIRVWEKREQYRPGTPDLPNLLGFARNLIKETQARSSLQKSIHADHLLDREPAQPDQRAQHQEWTHILRRLMDRLPGKQRRALELIYFEGLSTPEAAEFVGCSAKTIRRNHHMGLVKMQDWLRDKE